MKTIVPPTTPRQSDARFVCPICATGATSAPVRDIGPDALEALCVCAAEHIWTVRWLAVV